jgi:undecaprenyl-diphosphatase
MFKRIHAVDVRLVARLCGIHLHPRLRSALRIFARAGDGWFWLPVILAVFITRPHREFAVIISHCLFALAASLALYLPLKLSIRRVRPFQRETNGLPPQVPPLDRFSLPSGHTMNNLAVGLTLASYYPSALFLLILLPILWGITRVYFRLHFFSDVVVAAVLGLVIFRISQWLLAEMSSR